MTIEINQVRPRRRFQLLSLDGGGVRGIFTAGILAGAFTQVQHLIGRDNAYRLDPQAPSGLTSLDAVDARDLKAKAACHSRSFCPTFESTFADHTAAPYKPWYGPNARSR